MGGVSASFWYHSSEVPSSGSPGELQKIPAFMAMEIRTVVASGKGAVGTDWEGTRKNLLG